VGSPRELWLISAFYLRKQADYLQTATVAASSINPDQSIQFLGKYSEIEFPWEKAKKARREKIKKLFLDMESKKTYLVKPNLSPQAIKRLSNLYGWKKQGFFKGEGSPSQKGRI